jgi:SAM-dependent methyltransferase
MLDTTLANSFVAGTNHKGDMASADWRFLLPRLQFGLVLCLGVPRTATLLVLSNMCERLEVLSPNQERLRQVIAESEKRGATNVKPVVHDDHAALPYPNGSVDLIFVVNEENFRKRLRDIKNFHELGRILTADGVIYFEWEGSVEWLSDLPQSGFSKPQILGVTPRRGEMQTAVPLHDDVTTSYFQRHLLSSPSLQRRVLSGIDKLFGADRRGVVAQRSPAGSNGHLPQYLVSLAKESGADVNDYSWGMSAQGRRNSRKVLFFLLNRKSGNPEAIIKLTRSPALNARLENEYRALAFLNEKRIVGEGTFPPPLFFGYRGNLAMLGQKIIHGKPFRKMTKRTIDCPLAKAGIEWMVAIGAGSVDPAAVTPQQAAAVMTTLFEKFAAIYKLSSRERDFMTERINAIAQGPGSFPTVFQHGDPGIWNVFATGDNSVAFLDWEAAESQGAPLWDLFYFLRSYGTWMARGGSILRGDALKSFAQNFMMSSEFNTLVCEITQHYCERVNLDKRLIEPLFYTCWMHRALKESTRLSPANLEKGHYFQLLRLCIERRQTPGFARLFSPQG